MRDFEKIKSNLDTVNVLMERWGTKKSLGSITKPDEILTAYKESIDRLNARYHFQSVDVVTLRPDNPKRNELRQLFINEHVHEDFEVRFFVEGKGLFYLHIDNDVYCILCGKGDLISVPAHTKHWFDMGSAPNFSAIRLFTTNNGWEARFTESNIAANFPDFDNYLKIVGI